MARFILDIDTDGTTKASRIIMDALIEKFIYTIPETATTQTASVTCVNNDSDTQFHCATIKNRLTYDEIKAFNDNPHG